MVPNPWQRRAKVAVRGILAVLVLAFVGRHVARTWRDLDDRDLLLRLDPGWLLLAVGLYIAGLTSFGAYFGRVLAAGPTPVPAFAAIRAYLISHLGKYVPGKALVVVMRAGLVAPSGVSGATATFATLYETLVMMAGGGLVAALGFAAGRGSGPSIAAGRWAGRGLDVPLWSLALGLALSFLILTRPGVFGRLAKVPLARVGPEAMPRFSGRLLAEGLAWAALGWTLLGLSQVAVIRGLVPAGSGLGPGTWPLAVASVALATVAGFAVPIAPGGLGVREWVLWTSLAAAVDRDLAVVAALVLRLAWIGGEVVAAAALIGFRPASPMPRGDGP